MSASKERNTFNIKISIEQQYAYFVTISLFDADNLNIDSISSSQTELCFILKKGLYIVRVEMNGEIKDTIVKVDNDKKFVVTHIANETDRTIHLPPQFSSALLDKTVYLSSHEYYTYPSIELSSQNTFDNEILKSGESSLFIFLRYPSIEKYKECQKKNTNTFYEDFELIDQYGNTITHFRTKKGIELDENFGWVAFSAQIACGVYYLIYRGKNSRQIPISVFENGHTQFFMTLDNEPLFGSIRMFISQQRVFDPYDEANLYLDILLDRLQNNEYYIDENFLKAVAEGKYRSPILVLVCLYMSLKSNSHQESDQLYALLEILETALPEGNTNVPDLQILRILIAEHSKKTISVPAEIKETPIIKVGFESLVSASIQNEKLIPQNSVNDFASENICYDSPFTTFKPIPINRTFQLNLPVFENIDTGEEYMMDVEEASLDYENVFPDGEEDFEPKRKATLENSIEYLYPEDNNAYGFEDNWIINSVSDLRAKDKNLTLSDLSQMLHLPKTTLARIVGHD